MFAGRPSRKGDLAPQIPTATPPPPPSPPLVRPRGWLKGKVWQANTMSSVDINPQNQFLPQNKADFGRGRADSRVAGVRRRVANPRGHATDRNPDGGQSPGSLHAGRGGGGL